ncbi:hypothetical protein DSM101010T_13370 [Desulfovibrio subterraneus]|jgi:uncharacterized protein (TIGR00255 family)|uniref:YicC family protein n=2 Tax=Desulfovibrio subterraneus TaxID=2718620 RepID=A0A7J0BIC1_9BACT|nr:hypothetical protein DSM101010T_13370 [Desulfovibrio subterraneus]
MEGDGFTMTWEVRSVNSRHLDVKWRLPVMVRSAEARFEKVVRRFATRGRVDVSLNLQVHKAELMAVTFNASQAGAMLDQLGAFAASRGEAFAPDYNRLLGMGFLWEDSGAELDEVFVSRLEEGLAGALQDWNLSREAEAVALEKDMLDRIARMEEWTALINERAPQIKEDRFALVRERLREVLARNEVDLEEQRFLQEITLLSDKLDVSEEITRLNTHLVRLRELMQSGGDAGKRLDFTLQECFREINTCGNKIQDPQISHVVVDFKNEMEKCREQVQNLE